MLWLDIVMYQAFVLRTNLLLGKFLCPCIAEEETSLLFTSCLSPSSAPLKETCLQCTAWSVRWQPQLLKLSPALSHCPSAPWVSALSRAWISRQGFAPSLKAGLGAVTPFSLGGYWYKKPPQLPAGVVAMAEELRMHRQAVIPLPPKVCSLVPPALTLPWAMGLKRGFPWHFPGLAAFAIVVFSWKFQSPSEYSHFFSHQLNDGVILVGWETLSCHSVRFFLIFLKPFLPTFFLAYSFHIDMDCLFFFSCSFSPQGSLWPYYLSFCIFIFLCAFPPLASLLHCTPCSCSLCAWYPLHTLCSFIFSL